MTTATQQSILFVIDAGLLGGNNGILKKLSDAGFVYEAVNIKMLKNGMTENDNAEVPEVNADNFPVLQITEPAIQNATVIIRTDTMKAFKNSMKYHAVYDPYNDLFDYANADTAFVKSWYDVRASDANCSIKVPVKSEWQEYNSTTSEGSIKNYTYSGNHARSDLFYSVGYTVYPAGFDVGNKSDFFTDFVKRQAVKLKGEILSQRIISTPDYVGREFTVVISDSFFVRSKLILKENILYQLLCGGPKDNAYTAYADAFFRSFKVTNKFANKWYYYESGLFSCNLPTPPLIGSQTINTSSGPLTLQTYSAEDYKEGISYLVSVYLYPPEHKFGGENQFYDELVAGAERQYAGKAIKNEKVRRNGITGRYVELELNNNKVYKVHFFFNGNIVYQYLAGGTSLAMQSENPQYFFDTFIFAPEEK
ncbi:MAG: hypothetical protein H7Y00_05380 [Fimbriimonadaceae bacterium]|nr:hypothetical protein [Chitinophagales bacterium]